MPDLFPIQERFGRVEAYLLDDEQGWHIRRFATGHGDVRETPDGIADLKRLLKA